ARPVEMHVVARDELKCADKRCLERRHVNLAVSLTSVAVAYFKERAAHVHGDVERGTGDQIFVVEIAGATPGGAAVNASRGRGIAHASEEWVQRNIYAVTEMRDHPIRVEW